MSIKGKTVFISGASSGIGEACARAFAANGARLILAARNLEQLQRLAEELQQRYTTETLLRALDVRDRAAVERTVSDLPEAWRRIDILINNAGLALGLEKLYQGAIEDWETMIDTNVKGLLYLTRLIVPLMVENHLDGHVINIGSIAGVQAYPNGAVYCATKAAVKFISDGLRMDVADQPIRVTNIQPGLVETNFSVVRFKGDEERAGGVYQGIKPLKGEDIADIALYCAMAPAHVQICEVTVTATHQASATVVHREKSRG
ncbi:serine 3-dehydrogenase [Hydrogenispora ethanolica]|jgi:NADP-dependent 3-hydroxy acid dehydrogenase YdfG|uniref:Serine 3-dehydrogenase n=1 Tax=Hydrogenispora ethanolica TaxID=1082276 RepID=A0A4R1RD14_HYDET|nr:SDR family NAD(P)-dependent oxidoreductase [Hydrogenispora ethanolica]TCL63751.1 serine 3-dehydrogenase [Hydrogenispora ethanolica]